MAMSGQRLIAVTVPPQEDSEGIILHNRDLVHPAIAMVSVHNDVQSTPERAN